MAEATRKRMMKTKLLPLLLFTVLLGACTAVPKDIAYFQKENNLTKEELSMMKNFADPTIREGDVLTIAVSATDPLAASSFNLPLVSFVKDGTTQITTSGTRDIAASQAMQTYTVNVDGNINFPVLGKVKVAGMRKQDVVLFLEKEISKYIKKPIVNLNISNYKVTVLGEVNRPGSYPITTDRVSILDALGYAGDMTIYGNRKEVRVIRDSNGLKEIILYDLTGNEFLADGNFYLQQNDVVYVEPNDKRMKNSRYSQTDQYNLSLVSTVASTLSVITSVILSLIALGK